MFGDLTMLPIYSSRFCGLGLNFFLTAELGDDVMIK